MDFCIGVDGGGSGCRAVVARRDGPVLGHAQTGPANVFSNEAEALANVRAAMRSAWHDAALGPFAPARVHVGLAGVLSADQAALVTRNLIAQLAEWPGLSLTVSDDHVTSVRGALGERDGALVAIGTGAFFAAQYGRSVRSIGGWGMILSDHGSGAWLGRELLAEVLLWQDEMAEGAPLLEHVWRDAGAAHAPIIQKAMEADAPTFAQMAPLIIQAAEGGDGAARRLMARGAQWIERGLNALGAETGVLCLTGGIGPHYADYLQPEMRARLVDAAGTALDGALSLAREAT